MPSEKKAQDLAVRFCLVAASALLAALLCEAALRLVFPKYAARFRIRATPVDANILAPNASYFRLHNMAQLPAVAARIGAVERWRCRRRGERDAQWTTTTT